MVDDPNTKPAQISETTITATGLRVVKALVGNPPQSVSDLARALGVTKTAIVAQLHELLAAGFVERFSQRPTGRGRPRHLFAATKAALLLLLARSQQIVIPAIWQAIDEIGGSRLSQQVIQRVSKALAEHYRRRLQGTTPAERLNEMSRLLCEEGMLVDIGEGEQGQLVLRRRSCPFIAMFEPNRSVCFLDQQMMSLVVGAPVRQTSCRHDGAPCCTFELDTNAGVES
jgi:predicted ArsR family transcriptional regulator